MRVGIIAVYVDYHRRGRRNRYAMQPGVGPLLAGLLPADVEVDVVNETWTAPDWFRHYDLLFISALHSDFDRARQISHYWRRRGARTVFGGSLASVYPALCAPYFDAIVVGDPERTVPRLYADFVRGELQPVYRSTTYDGARVATPRFELLAHQSYTPVCLEATRGCPFECDFCVLTGLGTRFGTRPADNVARDVADGLRAVAHRGWLARSLVGFADNNIGGSPAYLRELCRALEPLGVQWYAAATFNVVSNPELVQLMSRSGCRMVYVGLESFNTATLADMNKKHNIVAKLRGTIDMCRRNGILLISGLMLSPLTDSVEYIATIPERLRECGLHVPTFICFESPIPGTPQFKRLAASPEPSLMPNALLRDFTGYTLTVRPRLAAVDEFVRAYREVVETVYAWPRRAAKIFDDSRMLLPRRRWMPVLLGAADMIMTDPRPAPARTLVAGTDLPPPETVPLTSGDFTSEEERTAVMQPTRVTDDQGRVAAQWLDAHPVFEPVRKMHGHTVHSNARTVG
jgi:radical SAM superfamily enzyme YgiQ (UPF0313 family)